MAQRRYTMVFVAAVLTAGAATFGVYRVLEATKASSRIATRPVVVAAQDLSEGQSIDRVALQVAEWPVATVPPGSYASLDSVVGRVTRVARNPCFPSVSVGCPRRAWASRMRPWRVPECHRPASG